MNVPSLPFAYSALDPSPFLSHLGFPRSWREWVALLFCVLSCLKFPDVSVLV